MCSSGGHLAQLHVLRSFWERFERFWVTFDKPDARSLLKDERVYHCHFPTNRNLPNLARNAALAVQVLRDERPDVIVSTGGGVAVPFFYLGKTLGARLVFLEVVDRVDSPTLTGRLVYPVCDRFLVQWDEQKAFYPRAENWGRAL